MSDDLWDEIEEVAKKGGSPFIRLNEQRKVGKKEPKRRAPRRTNLRYDFDVDPFMKGVYMTLPLKHKSRRTCIRKGCLKELRVDQKWVCCTECKIIVVQALSNVLSDLVPGGEVLFGSINNDLFRRYKRILEGI